MPKYKKKPVVVEARQWTGENTRQIISWIKANKGIAIEIEPLSELLIKTLEGPMRASKGDYIIQGIKGEFYPCKPDIFEKTYELVESTDGRGVKTFRVEAHINIEDIPAWQEIIKTITDMLTDERIDVNVRREYLDKFEQLMGEIENDEQIGEFS